MNIINHIIQHLVTGQEDVNLVRGFDRLCLDSTDRVPYNWIISHFDTHGKLPSEQLFNDNFPAYRFDPSDGSTFDELAENGRAKLESMNFAQMIGRVIDQHDADDIAGARRIIADYLTEQSAANPLKVLRRSDLRKLPQPESLIEGIIDKGTVSMLNGFRGTGKSFLALDWACSIATGIEWLGHGTEHGRVLYVAAEGGYGQSRRVDAWEAEHEAEIDDEWFHMYPQPIQFAQADQIARLRELASVESYDLIIIDTLARSTVGLEENSAKDMGLFVDELYRLRDALGNSETAILVIHHTGYEMNRARGSSSLEAAMDTVFTVKCEGGDNPRPHEGMKLINTKQKDRAQHADIYMKLLPFQDSAVINETDAPEDAVSSTVKVLNLIMQNAGITTTQIREMTGLSKGGASNILRSLEEDHKATRTPGRGRTPETWEACVHY